MPGDLRCFDSPTTNSFRVRLRINKQQPDIKWKKGIGRIHRKDFGEYPASQLYNDFPLILNAQKHEFTEQQKQRINWMIQSGERA